MDQIPPPDAVRLLVLLRDTMPSLNRMCVHIHGVRCKDARCIYQRVKEEVVKHEPADREK